MNMKFKKALMYIVTLMGGIAIGYFICSFTSASSHPQIEALGNKVKNEAPALLSVPPPRHQDKEAVRFELPSYSWLLGVGEGEGGCAVGVYRFSDEMDTITGVGVWQGADRNNSGEKGVLGAKFYKESGQVKKINVDNDDGPSWEWKLREDGTLEYRIKYDKNNLGIKQYYDREGTPTKTEKVVVSHGS